MSTWKAHDERTSESQDLEREIKKLIVGALRLNGVEAEAIDSDAPLFHEGLGLDSLDALQLAIALHKTYGIVLGSDDDQTQRQLGSVRTIADLVRNRGSSRGHP